MIVNRKSCKIIRAPEEYRFFIPNNTNTKDVTAEDNKIVRKLGQHFNHLEVLKVEYCSDGTMTKGGLCRKGIQVKAIRDYSKSRNFYKQKEVDYDFVQTITKPSASVKDKPLLLDVSTGPKIRKSKHAPGE